MPRRKKPKSILVIGRRWFRKTYGNTYHTATIYVDGQCVVKTCQQYGYGEQYIWTAREWLRENGYLPGIEDQEALWRYCQRSKIAYSADVADVAREKDL
jgi:hypothetical protein